MSNTELTLIELQTQVAFQEDTIDQLNEVVTEQDNRIRKLEQKIASFYQEFQALNETVSGDVVDTRPPHY